MPPVLYEEVVEVEGKVVLTQEDRCQLDKSAMEHVPAGRHQNELSISPKSQYNLDNQQYSSCFVFTERTLTGESVHVMIPLNEDKLREDMAGLLAKGVTSIAVALMHSYTYPDHELRVAEIARDMGFKHISLSHQVMPMVRIVPR